ncbi:MAG: DUF2267 domain-containing protein [Myxococcales bacterium]|nr:DUF2267 domain-containing protein [Myxococcales bacterium]
MAKQPRRTYTAEELLERRRQRHESRTSSTYKDFLKELEREGPLTSELSERAATAVLCALEQRIIRDEAEHLEAQLPQRLRFLLQRCEKHEELLPREIDRESFLRLVGEHLGKSAEESEPIARAVLRVVSRRVTAGEIQDVLSQLPADMRALFPQEVLQRAAAEPKRARARPQMEPSAAQRRGLVTDIVNDLLELPFDAQLGVLRTIAPKVIHKLDPQSREGFMRDLNDEIARADRGEEAYDIRPIEERH